MRDAAQSSASSADATRTGAAGRETLRVTGAAGRDTLRTGAAGRATARTGATFFFCCWAVSVVVTPAFDAGADCAMACDDVWAATATAKAATNKLRDFRMSAPFSYSFSATPVQQA